MKLIKKLGICCLISFLAINFISCEDENPINDVQIDEVPTALTTATIILPEAPYYGAGESVAYGIGLPSSQSDVQILVDAASGFSSNLNTIYFQEGETTSDGQIDIPSTFGSLGFEEQSSYAFQVVGARLGEISLDEEGEFSSFTPSGEDSTLTSSEVTTLALYDRVPAASATGLNLLMDWSNSDQNDLDLEVIDRSFTALFETAYSGDRYEEDLFDNVNPDGVYDFYVTIYDPANAVSLEDISVRFFVTDSLGDKTLLELVVPAGTTNGSRFPVATFTKATISDVATYSNIELL